jgi:hypothetical protein
LQIGIAEVRGRSEVRGQIAEVRTFATSEAMETGSLRKTSDSDAQPLKGHLILNLRYR